MHTRTNTTHHETVSVLACLRALLPSRRMTLSEAMQRAELQAGRLLQLRDVHEPPVLEEVILGLPRIVIEHDPDLPTRAASGVSDWDNGRKVWVISVNPDEALSRQKITMLHEYKHILDHYHPGLCGPVPQRIYGLTPPEFIAEYFAGCVLMPRAWVKSAYCKGLQDPRELAARFEVSPKAMHLRLEQIGLLDAASPWHRRPRYRLKPRSPHRYHRAMSLGHQKVLEAAVS